MPPFLNSQVQSRLAFIIIGFTALLGGGLVVADSQGVLPESISIFFSLPKVSLPENTSSSQVKDLKKFSSEQDFISYIQQGENARVFSGGRGGMGAGPTEKIALPQATPSPAFEGGEAERVSGTNVQVAGIDEPDILKVSGSTIYFSSENYYWWGGGGPVPLMEPGAKIMSPEYYNPFKTKLVNAFPPADLKLKSEIDKTGNLLLIGDILVVFGGQEVTAFSVADAAKPEKKWAMKLEYSDAIAASRLYNGKIYLVVKKNINSIRPCPVEILRVGEQPLTIACQDIYHPTSPVPVDTTYTALVLNPSSGQVEKTVSFVGAAGSTVVYMSADSLYVTYSYPGDAVAFFLNFIKGKARDLFPAALIGKVEKLSGYDISQLAKMTELQLLFQQYEDSLSQDERLKLENEVSNRISDYSKTHARELERTGIAKINLADLGVRATGTVAGHPLNQFSLDEYKNNLRIAVTVGEGYFGYIGFNLNRNQTANDVYVLDAGLNATGQVLDLGAGERIYSARFIADRGYVVTFRQTDPFYVLNLADPANPSLSGELKIPGYSSYLDPLGDNLILGIGQDNWQVKASLFDVSDPANPRELDKYVLNEGWSDVMNTHHAFLKDAKHKVFFLPGGAGGYIFSYEGNKLSLKKAVAGVSAKRAAYLDDYLYIVGDTGITVLNENDWSKVNELKFD